MMMKFLKLIVPLMALLALHTTPASAGKNDPETLFQQANQAYMTGNFNQAVAEYLTIAGQYGVSASLLYNLANSYAALGDTGRAVVNYKRARRLAPGDADIQANLEQIRKDAGLYRDKTPLLDQITSLLGPDRWLMPAGASFGLLALTALAANLLPGLSTVLTRTVILTALLISTLSLAVAVAGYRSWNDGVVVDSEARLLISPFAQAASTGTIAAGRLVRPGKTHGKYVLVVVETGRTGWLEKNQLELIPELPR
jgi:tetratricopeptide (TPR) repeat protein